MGIMVSSTHPTTPANTPRRIATALAALASAFTLCSCAVIPDPPTVLRATPAPVAEPPPGAGAVWPTDGPELFAQSAILIDARSGEVLFQKNADQRRQVASTQKLLTALLIAERGGLDEPIVITRQDTFAEPVKLNLRAGERYTRRALLEAIMVKSCNDACAALARDHSGSQGDFALSMNNRATLLGATDSRFANSHGLPASQYSTARDIARIAFRAYRHKVLREMMLKEKVAFRRNNGRITVLEATNKLIGASDAYTGMKTGYTNAAGRCLVSSGRFNGREVILVQLGSKTRHIFYDAARVMRWQPNGRSFHLLAASPR